jgi:magnesium transporter
MRSPVVIHNKYVVCGIEIIVLQYDMLNILVKTAKSKELQTREKMVAHSWVTIEEPTDDDFSRVADTFNLDIGILKDSKDTNELPRAEVEDGVLYLFTRFVYGHGTHVLTAPMLLVLTEQNLVSIALKPFPRMERFITGAITFDTQHPEVLAIKILRQVSTSHTVALNTLGKKIFGIGRHVEQIRNRDIVEFVRYENILYDINSALVRNDAIYRNLLTGRLLKLDEDTSDYLEDLALENGQNLQIAKDLIRNLVNIREAYSTILTNNLNYVIKLFTSLTIVLTVPTIIGTFYGMNVGLPFAESSYAFILIVSLSGIIMAALLFIFVRKDWI